MSKVQDYGTDKISLGFSKTMTILLPYIWNKIVEQVKIVWFIIAYLLLFQIIVLNIPIVYAFMIGAGVLLVILGLAFFMEGLEVGLMPFGEIIGSTLPRKSKLPVILIFAFLLGIGATLAEPAITVLKAAGSGVEPDKAPLLYSILTDFSGQLVGFVGIGVGLAVLVGLLRFMYGWSLKTLIIPIVLLLFGLTIYAHFNDTLNTIVGLAWDCGAVTTGPVTVPLVLALGIGICRIVSSGSSGGSGSGFGIVTLASLFPIVTVLCLGIYHLKAEDYYGQPNYKGKIVQTQKNQISSTSATKSVSGFNITEYQNFLNKGNLPEEIKISYEGGDKMLINGKMYHTNATIVYEKAGGGTIDKGSLKHWDPEENIVARIKESVLTALQAIIPLSLFLYLTLRVVLREKVDHADEIFAGITFAVIGMAIFVLGILLGLTPLGGQLGSNVPGAFTTIIPWELEGYKLPIMEGFGGKMIAVVFAFFLGYGATLAEPALNALGSTVEKITVGAFKKSLLMTTVATGVGTGIGLGILKIAYNIPLEYLLLPPYLVLIFLTIISSEEFVNFGWDSAGVTTGPITVPLVLAMGLGVGGNVPGVIDGFGVLSLASVAPIIAVLTVGLIVSRQHKPAEPKKSKTAAIEGSAHA